MADQSQPNVAFSLFVFHKIITRGLQVSIQEAEKHLSDGFTAGSLPPGYLNYVSTLVRIIDSHHTTEDELAFPDFKKLLPNAPFQQLMGQHQEMVVLLGQIQEKLNIGQMLNASGLQDLLAVLQQLNSLWLEHIALEEAHFDPAEIGPMLPSEEHVRMIAAYAQHSQGHMGPPQLAMPFILYNLPPDLRIPLSKSMPQELVEHLVPVVWKPEWEAMTPYLIM